MTIAEVSAEFDLTQDTLRYYERIGLIPRVKKNKSGIRDYGEEDLKWVGFIKCMRASGLPIEVLIEYVALCQQGDETSEARKDLLIEQKRLLEERIREMQETRDRLAVKIEGYEQFMRQKERELVL